MKTPFSALLLLAFSGAVSADLPRKAALGWASNLVEHSPFTSPPVISGPVEDKSLDAYALLGVSPLGHENYRVTLVQKSAPGERIIVDSNQPRNGFVILEINRTAGNPLATTVRLQLGNHAGSVGFDSQMITVANIAKPAVGKSAPPVATIKSTRPRVAPPHP